ncbi:MAG TPA: PspC domain-containing protein [Ilumatobacteraceae bacterium]
MTTAAETMGANPMDVDPNASKPNASNSNPGAGFPPPLPPPPRPAAGLRPNWLDVPIARDRSRGKGGGVLAGVSAAYGLDLRNTRIAVAIVSCVLPVVAVAYLAAWVLLPPSNHQPLTLRQLVTDRRRIPLLVAGGVVVVVLGFGVFRSWLFLGGYGWGVALIGIGVLLWLAPNFGWSRANWQSPTQEAGPFANPPPAASAAPTTPPAEAWHAPTFVTAMMARPRRRRYAVQGFTLVVAATVGLMLGAGNAADWWHVRVLHIVIADLVILIVGSVVGAFINRSWVGVPFLFVLTVALISLLVIQPNLDGGLGEKSVTPTTPAEATQPQRLAVGRLRVDLSQAGLTGTSTVVDAEVGVGEIDVVLPAATAVHLITHLGAGHVVVDGDEVAAGVRHDDERTLDPQAGGGSALTVDLDLGAGEINVVTAGS